MADLLNVFEQTILFENALPLPMRIDATQGGNYTVVMQATEQFLGLYESNTDTDSQLQTTVWGYGLEGETVTYPGPTFVAQSGEKIKVKWVNDLPLTGYFNDDGSYFLPIDLTLHRADPKKRLIEEGYVPTVPHLHGGHTQAKYDGYPEAWFVQQTQEKGKAYDGNNYTYDNDQRGATLWYHDHGLGVTRLNVYAGLAGFYLLRDDTENALIADGTLPSDDYEIEMALQDRAFTADGDLFLPSNSAEQEALYGEVLFPNTDLYELTETVIVAGEEYLPGTIVFRDTEDGNYYLEGETYEDRVLFEGFDPSDSSLSTQVPSAMAEFFGNVIMVNGMAWPSLEVDNTQYRFRMLNGADSRFYIFGLQDTNIENGIQLPTVYRIGTDGGLLEAASEVIFGDYDESGNLVSGDLNGDGIVQSTLVIAPGERHDLVFDFTGLEEENINLLNFGPASEPFGGELTGFDTGFDLEVGDPNYSFSEVGNIMQFQVQNNPDAPIFGISDGTELAPDDQPLDILTDPVAVTRKLGLFEGIDEFGRINPLVGLAEDVYNTDGELVGGFGPQKWAEPTTEKVLLDSTEIWEFYNFTGDAHPVHMHLVQFEVLGWQTFDFTDADEDGIPDDITGDNGMPDGEITIGEIGTDNDILLNPGIISPEERYEDGWQDTTWVGPGEVLRVKALFDLPGEYVWHCHILSHEDHEMMRPFEVVNNPNDLIAAQEFLPSTNTIV